MKKFLIFLSGLFFFVSCAATKPFVIKENYITNDFEIFENNKLKYFGIVENGKVISTCYCLIIPNLTRLGSSIAFVENVVTDKDYRGQGLSRTGTGSQGHGKGY